MRKMLVRGILFDKDGTLLDFHETWMPANWEVALNLSGGDEVRAQRMLVDAGYDAATERCLAGTPLSVGTTDELIDLWRPGLESATRLQLISEVDDIFARSSVEHMVPVKGLRPVLAGFLDEDYVLGIATNDGTRSAEMCVERLGLVESFSFVTGYDGVANAKPAADMGLAFCAACGLQPQEMAVVGDNSHDLEMGRAAGAGLCVGVLTGTGGREDLAPVADIVLGSVADLPQFLRDMNQQG